MLSLSGHGSLDKNLISIECVQIFQFSDLSTLVYPILGIGIDIMADPDGGGEISWSPLIKTGSLWPYSEKCGELCIA